VPTTTPPVPSDATNWGDIPTWVGAGGTCVATVAVIVTGVFVFLTFRKQADALADQKTANERQAAELSAVADERQREATERRRAQAAQVFLWCERADGLTLFHNVRLEINVENTGLQPIYKIVTRIHQGANRQLDKEVENIKFSTERHIMSGRHHTLTWESATMVELITLNISVEFTDAAGVRWQRREGGELIELPNPTPPTTT
jgi:mannitol-specific phosphotransferase system IIBC component